ncbi:serine/threonine-protein kinase [Nonomuraea sp. SBT364]|uniref:serine/threonine-protein kinase n=1 Tax=Nonomuraea sp. SBT364 TaxID=1580530 RepID=UPI00069DC1CA|nr:serine/threonine-protein kinase [Nonomuraea sp. SBT364]
MSTRTQEHLGPYRLIEKIGEGGMGVVHLGLDGAGRKVAIKVLHPHVAADLKARDRLVREVETMRRVRSPYVAETIDAELTGSRPYVVTRFAPGRTLEATVLDRGPLGAREVVALARKLCQALVDIHEAGVVHRDLKPSNVMLTGDEPLVIDFGIAHLVNAARLTQSGMFVGTPGYLAPEVIRDSRITPAADVHALASTVFFAATGLPPFGTGTFEAVCFNTLEGRAQIDRAPAWLRGWLSRALQVDPAARPGARELLRMAGALDPAGRAEPVLTDRTLTLNTVSDLLPPVQYAPSGRPSAAPAPTLHAERPEPKRPSPPREPFDLRRFLAGSDFAGVLLLVVLMALTVLMPVAVGLASAALSLALRAGAYFLGENRRTLSRVVLVTAGHIVLSLALGIAASSFLNWSGRLGTSHVEPLAASMFTLGLFVLPGAGTVRQAASHTLARLLPGHRAMVVSSAVLGPVALISVITAVIELL